MDHGNIKTQLKQSRNDLGHRTASQPIAKASHGPQRSALVRATIGLTLWRLMYPNTLAITGDGDFCP
jgi:hypothetical protein